MIQTTTMRQFDEFFKCERIYGTLSELNLWNEIIKLDRLINNSQFRLHFIGKPGSISGTDMEHKILLRKIPFFVKSYCAPIQQFIKFLQSFEI